MLRRTLIFGILFLAVGCGVQQIEPANRRFVQQLMSATSSKKTEWLDETVKQIEKQRSQGELSDEEYAALAPIIKKARQGDWPGAQRDAFALSEGQQPTAEDLEKIKPGAGQK
jgi:hypothetical protein